MRSANDNQRRFGRGWWPLPVIILAVVILLALAKVYLLYGQSPSLVGRASVIDGDTIEIHGQRIRFWGIDAPEGRQRCLKDGKLWRAGTAAANALDAFLASRPVSCEQRDIDRYKRIVATCNVAGESINAWLVREGWAFDYERYSKGHYAEEQESAKANRRGVWAGECERPWEWRRK